MSKRHLTVQNQGEKNEHQVQASSITTRSSLKRPNTSELIPAKQAKINVDKENIPKRRTRRSTQTENREPTPPPEPVKLLEPTPAETTDSDSDESDISDEEEQESFILPANDDDGEDYPGNKQYLIYTNAGRNKEPLIISKTARYWSLKYRKVLRHVFPDAYDMYIHADFSCYGELEVVENCLLDLTKTIFIVQQPIIDRLKNKRKPAEKVNYVLGFRRLEALTILLNYTDGISGIDDGDRFYDIMRVIGACYVTILRGLLPQVMFKKIEKNNKELRKQLRKIARQIPNFKYVLEQALIVGHLFLTIADVCSGYTKILQILYCNWVHMMEETTVDFNKITDDDLSKALKHAANIDINNLESGEKETFNFLQELRLYESKHGLGGDAHDISKWSRSQRAEYAVGRFRYFDNFFF